MSEFTGNGIPVSQPFNMGSKAPVDGRSIANNLDELNERKLSYVGQIVWVKDLGEHYVCKEEGKWVPLTNESNGDCKFDVTDLRDADYEMI